jgi:NADH dehydrogenase
MAEASLAGAQAEDARVLAQGDRRPQVVIVGAGFGGLAAAKRLGRAPVDVVVVDRENHHLFQPLVYEVAMAALSATDVSAPIRSVVARYPNTRVVLADARAVDLDARRVVTDHGDLPYDYVVIAAGTEPSYFGHDDWEPIAPSPKGLDAAIEIRKRVLLAFEEAEWTSDPARRQRLLVFVVVGGGPTGVEFAGALADLSQVTLARDFRRIDPRRTRVHLVEAGPRLLPAFPGDLSVKAQRQLQQLGVTVHLGSPVVALDRLGVTLGNGERLDAATVIWGAGVQPKAIVREIEAAHDRQGRIVVAPDLSIPGHPEAFVVGDVAHFDQDGVILPGIAPVAIQEGRAAASAIAQSVRGKERRPFRYLDKGTLATIGRRRGVGVIFGLHVSGFIAWLAWALVHIAYLIGFRNRLAVMSEWMWNYLTFKRGARVIEGLHPPPEARGLPS